MLYVLTFMACLSGGPGDRCEAVEIDWAGSYQACAMLGQREVARWVAEHRGYALKGGWRCQSGRSA